MKVFIWLSILAGASPAAAAPTYFACVIDAKTGPFPINIVADEATQQVMLEMPTTNNQQRLNAMFSPDKITVRDSSNKGVQVAYLVSRVTMKLARIIAIGNFSAETDYGTCKLQEAPKRAF